jgi:hypothetical protein
MLVSNVCTCERIFNIYTPHATTKCNARRHTHKPSHTHTHTHTHIWYFWTLIHTALYTQHNTTVQHAQSRHAIHTNTYIPGILFCRKVLEHACSCIHTGPVSVGTIGVQLSDVSMTCTDVVSCGVVRVRSM